MKSVPQWLLAIVASLLLAPLSQAQNLTTGSQGCRVSTTDRTITFCAPSEGVESTPFPSEGVAAPAEWPGVGWSDHWSFWQENYPVIMITDTAVFRYPYYHTPRDTFDKVNFDKAARVVDGVHRLVETLANEP